MESIEARAARGITVWAQDENTEIEIGINRAGELFLGNSTGGYNLPDTDENRARVEADYMRYTGRSVKVPR